MDWPDFTKNIKYLIPQENIPYDEQRKTFNEIIFICKFLCSDIGYRDMLVQFDNGTKFEEAKELLSKTNLKWQERN